MQKLRKRLSHENSKQGAKSSAPGRVPSFYTSRSIVNLSGLSVSDPLPGEKEYKQADSTHAALENEKEEQVTSQRPSSIFPPGEPVTSSLPALLNGIVPNVSQLVWIFLWLTILRNVRKMRKTRVGREIGTIYLPLHPTNLCHWARK